MQGVLWPGAVPAPVPSSATDQRRCELLLEIGIVRPMVDEPFGKGNDRVPVAPIARRLESVDQSVDFVVLAGVVSGLSTLGL